MFSVVVSSLRLSLRSVSSRLIFSSLSTVIYTSCVPSLSPESLTFEFGIVYAAADYRTLVHCQADNDMLYRAGPHPPYIVGGNSLTVRTVDLSPMIPMKEIIEQKTKK